MTIQKNDIVPIFSSINNILGEIKSRINPVLDLTEIIRTSYVFQNIYIGNGFNDFSWDENYAQIKGLRELVKRVASDNDRMQYIYKSLRNLFLKPYDDFIYETSSTSLTEEEFQSMSTFILDKCDVLESLSKDFINTYPSIFK